MIDITFTVTRPEYMEAQRLFTKSKRRKRNYLRWVCYAVLVIAAVGIATTNHAALPLVLKWSAGYLVLLAFVVIAARFAQTYMLEKRFKIESKFLSDAHMVIDATGIRSSIDGVGEGVAVWTAFSDWLEGPTVFEIIAGYTFRPIPKRVLSPEQQAELRSLLSAHIEKPH